MISVVKCMRNFSESNIWILIKDTFGNKVNQFKTILYKYFAHLSEKEKIRNLDYVRLDYMKEMIKNVFSIIILSTVTWKLLCKWLIKISLK